jgi:hypothetical protein
VAVLWCCQTCSCRAASGPMYVFVKAVALLDTYGGNQGWLLCDCYALDMHVLHQPNPSSPCSCSPPPPVWPQS